MRILVTGATGLIGRNLLDRVAPENEVVALTRRPDPPETTEGVQWVRQDLTSPLDHAALPGEVDAIVHLAQSERFRDFPDGAEDVFEVNVHSTFRLLEYARRVGARSFVLASTGGLYATGPAAITESAPIAPPGPYFRSKRIAELLLDDYDDILTGVTLRFFFVYGPGPGRTLVPRLARQILDGEEITVEGDPGLRINPIFAADAAASVAAALEVGDRAVVNVAGGEVVSIGDLVQRLGSALGREPRVRHLARDGGEEEFIGDATRMRELLGIEPKTSLADGLRAVAASFAQPDPDRQAASTGSRPDR